MVDRSTLLALLEGNESHVGRLTSDHFAAVRENQQPAAVTVCCADSRVSQEGMWSIEKPGTVFTPSNIGNQAWDDHGGERIVDGSLLYPIHHAGTETAAIVGHTRCGAVTAAYDAATGGELPGPVGVAKWVELLVPVVEEGLESGLIDRDGADERIVDQLVEYNVDAQVQFLRDSADVPEAVSVYGFVYDFHGVYGEEAGRAYLVNADGTTVPDRIADRLPAEHAHAVDSLLY